MTTTAIQTTTGKAGTFTVGEGATVHLWSDAYACTIIGIEQNGRKVIVQRDKAKRTNRDRDVFTPGGFVGHTECPDGQKYAYERDEDGAVYEFTLRQTGHFVQVGAKNARSGLYLTPGRGEHYDYNF